MIWRVVIDPNAEAELDSFAARMAEENLEAALRFYDEFDSLCQRLAEVPRLGTARTFASARDVRMTVLRHFTNVLVYYRVVDVEQRVEILRVIHGARDQDAAIDRRS